MLPALRLKRKRPQQSQRVSQLLRTLSPLQLVMEEEVAAVAANTVDQVVEADMADQAVVEADMEDQAVVAEEVATEEEVAED